jgi:maltose O-acetyltransferase
MTKVFKYFSLLLYYLIFSKLPNYVFPGGKFYNWLRVNSLKFIIQIGKDCRIMRNIYVGNGNNISIGSYTRINENVRLDNVIIGEHVMIARESIILGKLHGFEDIEIPMNLQKKVVIESTIIEDNVWIGARVIIMPGKRIRKGCIIGAGAVLTKDTEENGVYVGVPAKLIKYRNKKNGQ